MAQDFANYSADQVVGNLCGIPIQGYGDGPFCRVRRVSPGFTSKAGSSGLVSHSRSNDHRGIVEFILEQTSSTNVALSALHNLDLFTANGAGVGPLLIKDMQGTSLYTAERARIMKFPDMEYARETGQVIWLIECAKLIMLVGGN